MHRTIGRNPLVICARLNSAAEPNQMQSNGFSSVRFDWFDRVRLVRKLNSVTFAIVTCSKRSKDKLEQLNI